jgi:hypothetical protein
MAMATMSDQLYFNVRVLALACIDQARQDIECAMRKRAEDKALLKSEQHAAYTALRWLQCPETEQLALDLNEQMVEVIHGWIDDATDTGTVSLEPVDESQLSFNL